jgi:uncharacterized membrane protein YhhN
MNPSVPRPWIALTLVACLSLIVCQLFDFRLTAIASKVIASCGFLAVAVTAGAFRSWYGKIMFAGLLLSAFGDVFLLGETQQLFFIGLLSFLIAHVIYVGAFLKLGVNIRWFLAAAVPVVLVSLGVSMWLTPHIAPYFLTPVRIYTVVISIMLIAAISTRGAGAPLLIPIGALLFYVSDLSVAAGKFVAPDFPNYVWGLPLYYTGQILLALSVAEAITRDNRQLGSSVR